MKNVKVIGERNTGTNLIETMLSQNSDLHILSSYAPKVLALASRKLHSEYLIDGYFKLFGNRYGGWKHADPSLIEKNIKPIADHTYVICMVRDPLAWLVSMYKRPYHMNSNEWTGFSEFLRAPLMTLKREQVDPQSSLTPIELWNLKTSSTVMITESNCKWLLVRYESLLQETEETMSIIMKHLDIQVNRVSITLPKNGVKNIDAKMTASEYKQLYENRVHLQQYSDSDMRFANDNLNESMRKKLRYI